MQQSSEFPGGSGRTEREDLPPANSIELNPATEADFEFARNVFMIAYRSVMETQYGEWNQEEQDKKFHEVWDDKDSKIQIVNVDGKPSGFLQVEELKEVIWLDELVLLPEVQGKGIGSSLLRQVQETAKQRHVPVRLNVLHKNPAIKLYQRLGFEPIGDAETYTRMEWKPTQGMGE